MKIITFLSILVLQTCISKPKPTDNSESIWSPQKITQNNYSKAYFASGCFWCVEAIYESVKGVIEVYSGYAGGITKNPNYYQIGTGRTGHAEAVEVIYDPNLVTYATLVQVFFGSHDPTTPNRQGPDYGSQYRSIAFYKTKEEQITKRYRDLSGKITSKESNVLVDYYYEEHGNRKFLTRNIRGENIQYPSEWTVPSGNYFVMGDNRDNSNDSTKDVGFVPRENFFGEASYLFMTWECWTCLPYFSRVGTID